jgi:DNA polymerase I-like protein with 3'-5' exonuclease and polymerase domains
MAKNALLHFDKRQAEWVVVAYYSGDANMIQVIESGVDPHIATAAMMTGASLELVGKEAELLGTLSDPIEIETLRGEIFDLRQDGLWLPRNMSMRQCGKKSNHGLNYDESYRTFALVNEISEGEAKTIIERYHYIYPDIRNVMHLHIRRQLEENRTLKTCTPFDRKQRFLGAWGPDLFRQAYSFIPQGTVGDVTNRCLTLSYNDYSSLMYDMELLQNVHDALTFQYPTLDWAKMAEASQKVIEYFNPVLTYRGREFRIMTSVETGPNLGSLVKVRILDDIDEFAYRLKEGYKEACAKAA